MWPNLFLVGTAKAGTSSIYAYLKQHPDVFFPIIKEPNYFSQLLPSHQFRPSKLTEAEYLGLYNAAADFRVLGDASPTYLAAPEAPRRICERIPDARILIILRDPVERAYSHYLMNVRAGAEPLPYYEALLEEQKTTGLGCGYHHALRQYIRMGFYAAGVQRYLELFGPEKVQILFFEDLKANASGVLREILTFLSIDPALAATIRTDEVHNPYRVYRNRVAAVLERRYCAYTPAHRAVPRKLRVWVRDHLIFKSPAKPLPDPRATAMLRALYEQDIQELELILERSLPQLRLGTELQRDIHQPAMM